MSDEIDKETITRKVTSNTISNTNTPVEQYRVSEQITTKVDDNNNAIGLILIILVPLALGAGIAAYFYYLNTRPAPTQIIVPRPTETIIDNKSTIIERNNTTTQEVQPATPQPAGKVEISVPEVAPQPIPTVTVTAQPQVVTPPPVPRATLQPQPTPAQSPNN
jgi:hypothetical protein